MLGHYPTDILISLSIFAISLWMLLIYRTNIIMMVFSLELLLLANILGFTITSIYLNDIIGEVFSVFILAMAAVETAVALCIILAYYRITNKHINPIAAPEELLGAIVLTIGKYREYTIITLDGLAKFFIILLCIYVWIWAPLAHGISGVIRGYYNLSKIALGYNMQQFWEGWVGVPVITVYGYVWEYTPENKRTAKLDEWLAFGTKYGTYEAKFWGGVWSMINGEFMPRRNNKLTELYYKKFAYPPDWTYIGYLVFSKEAVVDSWYMRFIAPHTIVGQRVLAKREEAFYVDKLMKEHAAICQKYQDRIDQFDHELELKEVYFRLHGSSPRN
jgi:NADH-quinone oxidoreductase subunit K